MTEAIALLKDKVERKDKEVVKVKESSKKEETQQVQQQNTHLQEEILRLKEEAVRQQALLESSKNKVKASQL
jgi:hypothetical protein